MPEQMLMPGMEIINDGGRTSRWPSAEKLQIVDATVDGRECISVVARRCDLVPVSPDSQAVAV